MWRDEVRAFSIAKGMPSWGALFDQLPQEGHPILWYAVLRTGYTLTHSNLVLPVSALLAAIVAAFLILRYAPFPAWLRLLSVFGAFLGYELSVSARNYGIGVMLMICSCVAFRMRQRNPLPFAACLFLLANTSIHAAMATLVILLYWIIQPRVPDDHNGVSIAPVAIALLGVALAIVASMPTPDLAWAVSIGSLDYGKVLQSIFMDPGKGLMGYKVTSITAVGELPWRYTPFDAAIVTRLSVDLCLAWLFWSLRGHPRAIIAIVVAIIVFEIFFRNIYTASLRHEGVVLFLIFTICWMESDKTGDGKRIAFGLLPLFALQSLALPFLVHRSIVHRESSSQAYGEFIRANPKYSNAVLMSEPDYLMESMPYYVRNPIFMPRQRELTDHVYFGRSGRRQADLGLGQLMSIGDSVSCSKRQPVLLAIGYPLFQFKPFGYGAPLYRGLTFTWIMPDWARLGARNPVAVFPRATTDEFYRVYEISGCHQPQEVELRNTN